MLNFFIFTLNFITKPGIIFFTGGSNSMPDNLYNSFIETLDKKFDIYKINFNDDYHNKIQEIHKKNKNLMLLGHSSGCVTAINSCKDSNLISKIILLDPVKTPSFDKKKDLNFLNKILIIDAELSYKWREDFPYVPFIPFFKINNEDLSISEKKIRRILIKNYGHTDLLDNPWRDLMHKSKISIGNPKRERKSIKKYHRKIRSIFLIFYNSK
tara:strand:- start:980 stop:1615 length:636 start_codon:yes stop_codon:yes gene_type:complete